jgi:probable rRNA maturation factor
VAQHQARQAGHELREEIDLLCTHGILHLLGYDHAEPDEQAAMFSLQDSLVTNWRAGPDPGPPGSAPGHDEGAG